MQTYTDIGPSSYSSTPDIETPGYVEPSSVPIIPSGVPTKSLYKVAGFPKVSKKGAAKSFEREENVGIQYLFSIICDSIFLRNIFM